VIRDWECDRSDITKAATSPDRPVADRLGLIVRGLAQLILNKLRLRSNPFWFLIFVSEVDRNQSEPIYARLT
jgi:hypothetical protein